MLVAVFVDGPWWFNIHLECMVHLPYYSIFKTSKHVMKPCSHIHEMDVTMHKHFNMHPCTRIPYMNMHLCACTCIFVHAHASLCMHMYLHMLLLVNASSCLIHHNNEYCIIIVKSNVHLPTPSHIYNVNDNTSERRTLLSDLSSS